MRQIKIAPTVTYRDPGSEAYLRWISHLPLLTPAEEVELAEKKRLGGKEGRIAKERLVLGNLRFVVSVANQYHHRSQGLSLSDLIEHGNIGLIRAVEKYDETRGFKFISYAVWWIRQAIMQAIAEHGRMVRLPLNQMGLLNRINRAKWDFEQSYEREPSIDELAEITDIAPHKIVDVLNASGKTTSVDMPIGDDNDTTFIDRMESDTPSTDSQLHQESLSTELNRAMSPLTERERDIVKMAFGIGYNEMSLEEIGEHFSLSRERVRQIKEKAVRRMRNHSHQLQAYL